MNKNNQVKESKESTHPIKGEMTYDDKVIEKIIGYALQEVDGLLDIKGGFFASVKDKLVNTDNVTDGVHVEVGTRQVATDLDIVVEYDRDIPAIVEKMKQLIYQQVKKMTALDVVEINVNVADIKTREEFEKDSVTMQDRVTDAAQATGEFVSDKATQAKTALNSGTESVKNTLKESRVE